MLKCPICGASYLSLCVDVNISVTCNVDADGNYALKGYWDWYEVNEAAHDQVFEEDLSFYCTNCGYDHLQATFDDDMRLQFVENDEIKQLHEKYEKEMNKNDKNIL